MRNYKALYDKICIYIGENDEDEKIIKLIERLAEIEFIEIVVTDDVAAYEIFETVKSNIIFKPF